MVTTGKALGGWPNHQAGSPSFGTAGCPPSLESIGSNKENVQKFVDHLLGQYTFLSKDIKHLLVANGVRFYKPFVEFLTHEPSGKYKDVHRLNENHTFVSVVSEY